MSAATGRQRGATEEGTRRAHARRLRAAVEGTDEDGESNRRTLKLSATQTGWTSPGPELKVLARNPLNVRVMATPAIARGSLFIRTAMHRVRIAKAR